MRGDDSIYLPHKINNMKKHPFSILAALFILLSSCHHDNNNTTTGGGNGGSWTFAGVTYHAAYTKVGAGAAGYSFYASSGVAYSGGDSTLSIQFYNMTSALLMPGTYTIAHQVPPDSGQVYIAINTGGASGVSYGSTVGYGPETVVVSTVNGKSNITGSGIKLQNLGVNFVGANYADSNSTLNLNVTQQ
jgi:hypothetical protein